MQIPSAAFGPCLTATVALLTGAYHLSRRKTQKLLAELFGITVSLGAISAMEQRASKALASAHEEALREVQYAGVKHADATSWPRGYSGSGNARCARCAPPSGAFGSKMLP